MIKWGYMGLLKCYGTMEPKNHYYNTVPKRQNHPSVQQPISECCFLLADSTVATDACAGTK